MPINSKGNPMYVKGQSVIDKDIKIHFVRIALELLDDGFSHISKQESLLYKGNVPVFIYEYLTRLVQASLKRDRFKLICDMLGKKPKEVKKIMENEGYTFTELENCEIDKNGKIRILSDEIKICKDADYDD